MKNVYVLQFICTLIGIFFFGRSFDDFSAKEYEWVGGGLLTAVVFLALEGFAIFSNSGLFDTIGGGVL